MMWYPHPAAARLRDEAQLRTLCACFGISVGLHALAMFAFPELSPAGVLPNTRELTALLETRAESSDSIAPVPAPTRPRERRVRPAQPPLPTLVDPAPVVAPQAEEPTPAQSAPPALASNPPEPAAAAALPSAEARDASLLEAYRLALIDAARRYKRYPVQAMERGWEGRVEIRVVVGANGMIKSALVKSSSRYQILDAQALDMVKKAFNALAQVRPAPHGREFTVDVPVIFELQTG